MTIDWFSFFLGMAVGMMLLNLSSFIAAYVRRKKALAQLSAAEAKLKSLESKLEQKKQNIVEQIKKEESK